MKLAIEPKHAVALGLFAASHAGAQPSATLPPIVVTSPPIVESNEVDAHGGFSTRVTDAQIRDLGALDIAAALRMTPGVQISRYNEVGSYSGDQGGNVYVRGLGASRPGSEIKTYLDGLPLYMGVWGHPLMDLLPLTGVASVDVRKGPHNMASGNNFASIELRSKRASRDGVQARVDASAGSFGTRTLQADAQFRGGDVEGSIAAGHVRSDGFRTNADGRLSHAMGRLESRIDAAWSIGASFLAVSNRVGDPGDDRFAVSAAPVGPYSFSNGIGRNESTTNLVSAGVSHRHGAASGELQLYVNNGRNDLRDDANWGTFASRFRMSGLRWKETFTPWKDGRVVAGVDHERITGTVAGPHVGAPVGTPFAFGSAGSAQVPAFQVTSVYAGVSQQVALGAGWVLRPSAGLRAYHSNRYASKVAPNAGVSLVSEALTLYANAARGLLYPGAETYTLTRAIPMAFAADNGWDRLSPSEDRHAEVGARWDASARTQVDASVFRDAIRNRYVWSGFYAGAIANPASGTWSNDFPEYRVSGAEVSVRHAIGPGWQLFGGATFLHSSLSNLPYAPRTAVSAGLTGSVAGFSVALDAQHQTKMYSLTQDRGAFSPNEVGAFTVANARVAMPLPVLGRGGQVYLALNNLFDAHYQYNAGYPMPGRNARLGVVATF